MDAKPKIRNLLDRQAWINLAMDVLAEDGLNGIRIEVLAKRLAVTKGSFYWHFKDRRALLDELLRHWKEGRIHSSAKQSEVANGEAHEQIRKVIDLYSINPHRKGMMIELAIRDWARRDEAAAAVVEEVDHARLHHATQLFKTAGFSASTAKMRALLLYTHAFGLSMMVIQSNTEEVMQLHHRIAELIAEPERN